MLPTLALAACLLGACSSSVDDVTAAITTSPSSAPSGSTSTSPERAPAITIETPLASGEVSSPVSVTGTADVEGNEVTVRVLDGVGAELAAIQVEVDCTHRCPGTFATELSFFVEHREPGSIQVSGHTPDGPAASTVPVVLFPV
jgi:immunoglobulin-like protein involved in spore germination